MIKNKLKIDNVVLMVLTAIILGVFAAGFCAAFNYSLSLATQLRKSFGLWPYLFLPFIGLFVVWIYKKFGNEETEGSNQIIEEIHYSKRRLRFRIVPLIMFTTFLSHLFGASVGREGVGVQIGAGIADQFKSQILPRKLLLMMGMSAGFGAIFSVPLAGAFFGIEVFHSGELALEGFIPCFIASFVGYFVASKILIHISPYPEFNFEFFQLGYLILSLGLGVYFGIIARMTTFCLHLSKKTFHSVFKNQYLQSFFGGLILLGLYLVLDSDRYHGLGENILIKSFYDTVQGYDFLGKIFSTAISIGSNFKGGEVMPIFYIGATSANALASLIRFPISFFVPLGMVSVFAGCANAPVTSVIFACEIFGKNIVLYAVAAVVVSYLISGKNGIYSSQKTKYKII